MQQGTKCTDNCPKWRKRKKTSENKVAQKQSDSTDERISETSLYAVLTKKKRS